jgi:hypothetical protein
MEDGDPKIRIEPKVWYVRCVARPFAILEDETLSVAKGRGVGS